MAITKNWFYDIFCLVLIIGCSYALFLGSRPLAVPDEARYVEIPREMLASHDFITPHLNEIQYLEKPPLFYWLQAGAIKWLGYNIWAWRTVTALLAILGCLLTYVAGRSLYDRTTAWFASLILASSLLYFVMAHYVTLDMAVSVFISGTLLSAIMALRLTVGRTRRFLLLSMYFWAALAILTKGLIGIVLPGMVIFSWLALTREWHQLKHFGWVSGISLFLLLSLPWHILIQLKNPEFFHYYVIEQQFLRYSTLIAQHYQPVWWFLPIVVAGIYPWLFLFIKTLYQILRSGWYKILQDQVTLYLLLWLVLILAFYSFSNSKLIPYILPIWPAMALLTAHYLTKQSKISTLIPSLIALISGLGLAAMTQQLPAKIASLLPIHLAYTFAIILLACGTINYLTHFYSKNIKLQLNILAITHMLVFSTLLLALPYLDNRSTKPLADIMQPLLNDRTEIMGYYRYYQDIPVYLQQRLTVINTKDELADGMRYQDASSWMIDDQELSKRWQSNSRLLLLVPKQYLSHLQNLNLGPYHQLGETKYDLLISNKAQNMIEN